MADYDSALPMRGNVVDGEAVDATNGMLVIGGTDGSNYQALSTDANGVLNVSATAWDDTNKIVITDGTDDLQIVVDGSAAGTNGVHLLGTDGTNAQILSTDANGYLNVNSDQSPGANSVTYATANLVKDTPTTTATLAGAVTVQSIQASGSGLMKVEVKYGTTASEVVIAVLINSTANPNVTFDFPDGLAVAGGETILLSCTNLESAASPASDFSGYGSIVTTA